MTPLHFTKMHGLGNDFMVVDAVNQQFLPDKKLVAELADRHRGIGFDQLLIVRPAPDAGVDFGYQIFNADGNEIAQCGNGARCIARFIRDKKLSDKKELRVATLNGTLTLQLLDGEKNNRGVDEQVPNTSLVKVALQAPEWEPTKIPFKTDRQQDRYTITLSDKTEINCGVVSVGNPHCVIETKKCDAAPVKKIGELLSDHPAFPEAINASFMEILARDHIRLRVYERGAGETLACGSAACAAVAVGRYWQLLDEKVTVTFPGGDLLVEWPYTEANKKSPMFLTGPATTVFDGVIDFPR